jgi:hypothetical protein
VRPENGPPADTAAAAYRPLSHVVPTRHRPRAKGLAGCIVAPARLPVLERRPEQVVVQIAVLASEVIEGATWVVERYVLTQSALDV